MRRRVSEFVRNGCQQSELRGNGLLARVHQQEATSAVRIFYFAGPEARLPNQRRLLIAQDSGNGHALDRAVRDRAIDFASRFHLRQPASRNFKRAQKFIVPIQRFQIEELRAAGVCHICSVYAAAGPASQIPQKKRIDISEEKFAALRALRRPSNVFQYPSQFQAAEICAKRKTSFCAKPVLATLRTEMRNVRADARVLPYDCVHYRLARRLFPDDGCLTLIRNADRCQIVRCQLSFSQCFGHYFSRSLPDLFGIVLHPAWLRENLFVLLLRDTYDAPRLVEHDEARARCALIDCPEIIFHVLMPRSVQVPAKTREFFRCIARPRSIFARRSNPVHAQATRRPPALRRSTLANHIAAAPASERARLQLFAPIPRERSRRPLRAARENRQQGANSNRHPGEPSLVREPRLHRTFRQDAGPLRPANHIRAPASSANPPCMPPHRQACAPS